MYKIIHCVSYFAKFSLALAMDHDFFTLSPALIYIFVGRSVVDVVVDVAHFHFLLVCRFDTFSAF